MSESSQLSAAVAMATNVLLRAGTEALFTRWQAQLTHAISGFPGFLSVEILPLHAGSAEWRIVQQFRSAAQMQAWVISKERRQLLADALPFRDDVPAHESASDFHPSGSVTEVIVTAVKPGNEPAFRAWCETIQVAQGTFPGYMGTYVQSPASVAQPFWTTMVRFSTPEQLDAWLTSDVRRDLISKSERLVDSWESRRMPSSFTGWFPGTSDRKPPAAWKQTAIVLLVLFPVVMLELRYLSPLLTGLNAAVGTFIGNAISVSLVSWPLAPIAIRGLDWWLQPASAKRKRAAILGAIALVILYAAEITIFWRIL